MTFMVEIDAEEAALLGQNNGDVKTVNQNVEDEEIRRLATMIDKEDRSTGTIKWAYVSLYFRMFGLMNYFIVILSILH